MHVFWEKNHFFTLFKPLYLGLLLKVVITLLIIWVGSLTAKAKVLFEYLLREEK